MLRQTITLVCSTLAWLAIAGNVAAQGTGGERRSFVDTLGENLIDIYDGVLKDVVLEYGVGRFNNERVFLLQFATEGFFEFDSDIVEARAHRSITELADALLSGDDVYYIVVVGHADALGTIAYNDQLSEKRALAIAGILEQAGVSSDRIRSVPLGERYPVTTNSTRSGRARNRRAEIYISRSREDARQAPRATPWNEKNQNDHLGCNDGFGECGPIAPANRPVLRPDGTIDGDVDLIDPIARSETVLRRSIKAGSRLRRRMRAPK